MTNRELSRLVETVPAVPETPPKARAAWLEVTKRAHAAFWADVIAGVVTPAAVAVVKRYFDLVDEHERALRDVRDQRYSTGSTGQRVMSPAAGYLLSVEGALQKLEAELGISPAARSRMKFEAASTEETLERLLRRARQEDE